MSVATRSPRRSPRASERRRERSRALVELAVGRRAGRGSRSRRGPACAARGRGASGPSVSSRSSAGTPRRAGDEPLRLLPEEQVAAPSKSSTRASGIRSASSCALRASTTLSASPCSTSVGAAIAPSRSSRRRSRPRPPAPASPPAVGRVREPVREDLVDELRPLRRRAGASAFSTNRRSATSRLQRRAASANSAQRPLRASGTRRRRPGVVHASTSLSTRSGRGERELLRDHPAEARAEDVRALDSGLVEDGARRRRPSARPCTAPAARRSRRCRGCRTARRGSARASSSAAGPQPQRVVAEPVDTSTSGPSPPPRTRSHAVADAATPALRASPSLRAVERPPARASQPAPARPRARGPRARPAGRRR